MPSMDFTVINMTEPLSVKWDLLIRIYPKHPGNYVHLEGDFKVFIVYEEVTIATSSIEIRLQLWILQSIFIVFYVSEN